MPDQKMIDLLKKTGQEHLLRFWDELDAAGKRKLAGEIENLDFSELANLIDAYVLRRPEHAVSGRIEPAPYFPLTPRNPAEAELYHLAVRRGRERLASGHVALLTVAGGQGTRLGFDAPKGTYPIAPVSGKSLFEYFAQTIRRAGEKYRHDFTWYIMTSVLNREATEAFFAAHDYFGLKRQQVMFFVQGTMPAFGLDGKLLLAGKDSLSLSPDGHGGTLLALRKSGALERMRLEGSDIISYFQVDNPLAPMFDPLFIGMHELQNSEMSAITLAKTGPFEKLGNFCVVDGKITIIEYSDLADELAESRNPDGSLRFIAGSPAIHLLSRDFVDRLTAGGSLRLPWHRADKKVPFVDAAGQLVKPETPNAVKLESFIFDALPLAKRVMLLEGRREDQFAPTKNATGVDSVESCREMMIDRDARWLEAAGVAVPRDTAGRVRAKLEFSPLAAIDAEDAARYAARNDLKSVEADAELYLG